MLVLHNYIFDFFMFDIMRPIIFFFNKYDFINFYYNIYINLYVIYKFIKKKLIVFYFYLLKLHIIFINDKLYFFFNNKLLKFFFKIRLLYREYLRYIKAGYIKSNKKYKYYYRYGMAANFKLFFCFFIIMFIALMWKNRLSYSSLAWFGYPLLFYLLIYILCSILMPLFYYKFIAFIFISFIIFLFISVAFFN